jgi:hypothetical protein
MPNLASPGASFGDLTTLADVKAWLQTGQSAFPATDDALLTRLITAASQFIQTWLNRQIASQDWIEIRDGLGGPLGPYDVRYQFAEFPVSAVSLVVVDGLTIPPYQLPRRRNPALLSSALLRPKRGTSLPRRSS